MFYKVENEMLIKAPEKGLKIFIGNPTDEQYKLFGYTNEIKEDERPAEEEGKFISEYYEQTEGVIYKHYRVMDMNEEEVQEEVV